MIFAFLSAIAVAAPPVRVEPGIHRVDGREVWLGGFELDATVGPEDACGPDVRPSADERRVAARSPAFVPSGAFELLALPSDEACGYTTAVVEAEGVDGWLWFGGWGPHLGEGQVVSGEGDGREGVVRVHQVAWHFFGEEAKPAPRASRCVRRDALTPTTAWVSASAVNVRAGRDASFAAVTKVEAGAPLQVWHRDGAWSWVEAPKTVVDRSGSEPETRSCTVFGWVKDEFLAPEPPDAQGLARRAEAALAAGQPAEAAVQLERAAALQPQDPALREALAEAYAAVGHANAAVVARQAAKLRARAPTRAWTPGAAGVSFATLCTADPGTAAWSGKATGDGCLLPWSPGPAEWAPELQGWIDLDPADLETQCGGSPGPRHRELSVAPPALLVRVPAGPDGRGVHVRRRVVRGTEDSGQFDVTGLGPWETVTLRAGLGAEATVLTVPMAELTRAAAHAVIVDVEVFSTADPAGPGSATRVQLVWPLNC